MVSGEGRPLPWATGPKLDHFSFRSGASRQIVFLERLGSAVHSHVFKVEIDGVVYALKMFKFYSPIWPQDGRGDPPAISTRTLVQQCDPFHSECRAYGRLKETGHEDLAVKVYGYLMMGEKDEDAVYTRISQPSDLLVDWERRPEHKEAPIRVIVKEYIQGSSDYTRDMVPAMMKTLKQLNSLGIQVWDIKYDNFMRGVPIDFSQAMTVPHFKLDLDSPAWPNLLIERRFYDDYSQFDHWFIDHWNHRHPYSQQIWTRFLKSPKYKLRSWTRRQKETAEKRARGDWSREFPIHPHLPVAAFYDWKRARKDLRAPVTHSSRVSKPPYARQ